MDRRRFCLCITAFGLLPSVGGAQANGAQLLLVRQSAEPKNCTGNGPRFIPGKLYGVASHLDLATAHPDLGPQFLTNTMELPYDANLPGRSSIPAGLYAATIRTDATKDWMTNENRTWRLELLQVPDRSFVQFHFGTNYTWSKGCIIVTGKVNDSLMCTNAVTSSETSMRAVREYVTSYTNSSASAIRIRIAFLG